MANELDNEREQSGFKKNIVGYIIALAIGIGGTLLLTDRQEPDLGSYPVTGEPEKLFEFEEIIDVAGSYNKRAKHIQERVREREHDKNFTSARAVTFKYQELKNYMKKIEDNADEAKIRIEGLRFYFGKYDSIGDKTKRYRQMVFYNPTVKEDNKEIAYAIERIEGRTKIVSLKKVIDSILKEREEKKKGETPAVQESSTSEASILSFLSNSATFSGAETQAGNHGQLNPPPPNAQLVPDEQ